MFKQMIVVFLKELKCIFRDKKTLIVGLIVPLLLLPCILIITDFSMAKSQDQIVSGIRIGIDKKENSFYSFASGQSGLMVVDTDNPQKDLNSGKIIGYVRTDENLDEKILKNENFNIDIQKGEDASINSIMASSVLEIYISYFKYEIIPHILEKNLVKNAEELNKLLLNLDITDYVQESVGNPMQSIDLSSIYFNMLVPLMLIMYCCVGSSSTAIDLSVGEKERGTLEPLLSTGASRNAVIIGKLLATTVIGGLSGICTTLGLWGYLLISSNNSVHLNLLEILSLLVITLFTAMFFSAINLTIGVYSKSSKEAQTYSTYVYIVSAMPTFFTYMMDVSGISLMHLSIPILNIVCVIKEVFGGALNLLHLGIVLCWLLIYVGISVFVMQRMFKKEEVLFRI